VAVNDMSQESLQSLILDAVAVVLLLQTLMLLAVSIFIVRTVRPLEQLIANASETLRTVRRVAERLDVALTQIDRTVQSRMEQADTVAREVLERAYEQAIAADKLIGHLLSTLEKATAEIERTVRRLFREGNALNAGMRAAVRTLFSRDT